MIFPGQQSVYFAESPGVTCYGVGRKSVILTPGCRIGLCWAETNPTKRISYYRSRAKVNGSQVYYNTKEIDAQLLDIIRSLTISETARMELSGQLQKWFENEGKSNQELKQAETRLVKLGKMEKNLQLLMMEEEISLKDFKEHRSRIEAERSRLRTTVDGIRQRQHLIKADFEVALQLATQFDFMYENGNFDQRRLLCETVLKRLYVEDGKITREPEYNAPFAIIARANGSGAVTSGGAEVTIGRTFSTTFTLVY